MGEFSAIYYDEEAEKFIKVNGIDPDASNVDCPTRLLIKFVARTRKRKTPWESWGLTQAEYTMLRKAYDDNPEDMSAVWRLVAARSQGIILLPFFEKMARQLTEWLACNYLIYDKPFSERQLSILRRQKKYHELHTIYRWSPSKAGRPAQADRKPKAKDDFWESSELGCSSPGEPECDPDLAEAC